MGVKAFLQKGRGKPGLILPANAVAKVNESTDRSALVRAAEKAAAPVIDVAAEIEQAKRAVSEALAVPKELLEPDPPVVDDAPTVVVPNPFAPPVIEDDADTEPDAKPFGQEVPAEPTQDLTVIPGIGPAMQKRLHNFGFDTFEKLANASPEQLNEIQGARNRGGQWVDEARKLLNA